MEDAGRRAARALEARIRGQPGGEVEWGPVDRLRAVYELLNDQNIGPCLRQCLKADVVVKMAAEAFKNSITLAQLEVLVELGRLLKPEELEGAWGHFASRVEADENLPGWARELLKMVKP